MEQVHQLQRFSRSGQYDTSMDLFNRCPLCSDDGIQELKRSGDSETGVWRIQCIFCGELALSKEFWTGTAFGKDKKLVRGIAQERRLRLGGTLAINSDTLLTILNQAPRNPADAADRLLLNLSLRSSEPGVMTGLRVDREQGFAFTDAIDSFVGYLTFLRDEGLIEFQGDRHIDNQFRFRLSLPGWRRVQSLRQAGGEFGFIAMAFAGQDELRNAIKEGARLAGWPAGRSDDEEHSQKIDDWIMNRIEAARFVIVDLTRNNPGAAFEAGYAIGLGRPVIWTVNEEWLDEDALHFDIRQYNHLRWSKGSEHDLAGPLAERIVAAVGKGPLASDQD